MATKVTLTKIAFAEPVDVPTLGPVGSVSLNQGELQAIVTDDPARRCVYVTSKDPRHEGKRVRVPYENVKAFNETLEEVADEKPVPAKAK